MHWWQSAVIYQIYPRSFHDSNGDGIGDLNGITARLPYLAELGVDAIWISPIYVSPMADFDALLRKAHALELKVLLDFVPNHTSDQHPWFTESRAARESAKRDWYI